MMTTTKEPRVAEIKCQTKVPKECDYVLEPYQAGEICPKCGQMGTFPMRIKESSEGQMLPF